jgi:hypothetical protein
MPLSSILPPQPTRITHQSGQHHLGAASSAPTHHPFKSSARYPTTASRHNTSFIDFICVHPDSSAVLSRFSGQLHLLISASNKPLINSTLRAKNMNLPSFFLFHKKVQTRLYAISISYDFADVFSGVLPCENVLMQVVNMEGNGGKAETGKKVRCKVSLHIVDDFVQHIDLQAEVQV